MERFKDKVAIVTGGCRGIGKAIVERFLNEGARAVYAADYHVPGPNEPFIEDKTLAGRAFTVQLDVTNAGQVQSVMDEIVADAGQVDILINNAGITRDNLIMRMHEADWDAVINTNLKGVFLCTKAIVSQMAQKRSGRIINMGSVVGLMGNAGQTNYAASKAGLIGFTKSIAKEFGSRNITANYIAPGFVISLMTDVLTDEQKAAFLQNIPLKRAATPTDIAGVVAFLCSEDAAYLTGQVIAIDGGLTM